MQLQGAFLHGHKGWWGPGKVFLVCKDIPHDCRELPCGGHRGDLHAAPTPDAQEERAQRPGGFRRCPRCLHEHCTSVRASYFANAAVLGRLLARLAHAQVQTEVTHELLRRGEPTDFANGREQPDGNCRVDTCDCEQALQVRIVKDLRAKRTINNGKILGQAIQLMQPLFNTNPFIQRQGLLRQPDPSLLAEGICRRATWDQVAGENGMNLVLQPRSLAHDLRAPCHLPPQSLTMANS